MEKEIRKERIKKKLPCFFFLSFFLLLHFPRSHLYSFTSTSLYSPHSSSSKPPPLSLCWTSPTESSSPPPHLQHLLPIKTTLTSRAQHPYANLISVGSNSLSSDPKPLLFDAYPLTLNSVQSGLRQQKNPTRNTLDLLNCGVQ